MDFILVAFFRTSRIAKIAIMTMTAIIVKSAPQSGSNPIEQATRLHTWLFIGYMVLIALVALFTYLVWRSGNNLTGVIQADADVRIQEARSIAAKADERSKNLEHDNLILRSDLNTEIGKVAGLQKNAADAKTAQQRVEIELAKQRERAAIAERDLLDLQQKIADRTISAEQRTHLIELLSHGPKGPLTITCVLGDGEGLRFAGQIDEVLKASGWDSKGVNQGVYTPKNPVGVSIIVHDAKTAPPYAGFLQQAFNSVGIPLAGLEQTGTPDGTILLLVGNKP